MLNTPKGLRIQIGVFGKRNAGKSSLVNALVNQEVSIVSKEPGTTTDPVEKAMELLPIGPVLFIDTAGLDDEGSLGEKRIKKSFKIIERADIAVLVVNEGVWGEFEEKLLEIFMNKKLPVIVAFNKSDISEPSLETLQILESKKIQHVKTSALYKEGISNLKEKIALTANEIPVQSRSILGDLIVAGSLVIMVVPIDLEAPKGRLILPQVQAIRDTLDNESFCMVVKERELKYALSVLTIKPALIVTDSQAFLKVAGDTPDDIPLTSFSILFARLKGNLAVFAKGAYAIGKLQNNDKVLIAEACSHHPVGDDIGRVKIPRWIKQYTGKKLIFEHVQGHDFPENLKDYNLIVHCGSCTFNNRELLHRLEICEKQNIPITNYGTAIAFTQGILLRVLSPFPDILEVLKNQ